MRTLIAALIFFPAMTHAAGLASLSGDFTGDGIADRAALSEPDDLGMAGLEIYIGQPGGGEVLAVRAPALIWVGGIGQQPELAITDTNALKVVSMNEAIGRNRWRQTLTIAYQNDRFMLVGFDYNWFDTLDLANRGNCLIDLPAGRGLLTQGPAGTEATFQFPPAALPIENWPPDIPRECGQF